MIRVTFTNPGYLWFLFILPLVYILHFYFLRKSKQKALKFANFRVLKRITGKSQITNNYLLLFLRIIVFSLMILGVAGLTATYEGPANKNSFVIAIDTSASMTAGDIPPTRLEAAKTIALDFMESVEGDTNIGLMTFSGISMVQELPTNDNFKLKNSINNVKIDETGGTDIPTAIITATNMLLSETEGRNLILITDGSNTVETFVDDSLSRALEYAKSKQVKINTIGLGSNAAPVGYLPEYYNIPSTYNEDNLVELANETQGQHFYSEEGKSLQEAFNAILNDTTKRQIERPIGKYLLLLGLIGIILEWFLINTRFRKLP